VPKLNPASRQASRSAWSSSWRWQSKQSHIHIYIIYIYNIYIVYIARLLWKDLNGQHARRIAAFCLALTTHAENSLFKVLRKWTRAVWPTLVSLKNGLPLEPQFLSFLGGKRVVFWVEQ
jgi:hypothetical protein